MFDFDFGLGEDIDLLRDSVREFATDRIAPRAAEIDRSNQFPRDLWPELGKLGLLGITVEEEHGGAGMGYLAHCVAMEEISRGSASVIVPLVNEATHPRSVVDVGCGLGAWLAVFAEHGVDDVLGIDGPWVDRTLLEIPPGAFRVADLHEPIEAERRYDLTLCLEVGQLLEPAAAALLVAGDEEVKIPARDHVRCVGRRRRQ